MNAKSYTKLFFVGLLFLIIACKNNVKENIVVLSPLTDNSNKYQIKKDLQNYFADSIAYWNGIHKGCDSLNYFHVFSNTFLSEIKAKNIWDDLILAFDEPYIDTTEISNYNDWIRITVAPCFRKPYCLKVEKKFNRTFITAKVLDGDGGYHSGLLLFSYTTVFSDTLYDYYSEILHKNDFWKLIEEDTTIILVNDGETWTFEAIENGNYNIIYRPMPQYNIPNLAKTGFNIIKQSKMLEILSLKTGDDIEKLEKDYF